MAADGLNKLQIQLIHGPVKHDVTLELAEGESGEVLCISHLMQQIAHITSVPIKNQRLILKGKSLTNLEASVKSYGLRNGSKVMLIGRKVSEEDDGLRKQITTIENDINRTDRKLSDIIHEVDGIHRGFLATDLEEEALKTLGKRLAVCIEEFTRLLESFDRLSLENAPQEIRNQRKKLVHRIQSLLTRCDGINHGMEDMLNRKKLADHDKGRI